MKLNIGLVFSIVLSFSQAGAVPESKELSWICPASSREVLKACLDEKLSDFKSANCRLLEITKDRPIVIGDSQFMIFENKAENCFEARTPSREATFRNFPVFVNGTSI